MPREWIDQTDSRFPQSLNHSLQDLCPQRIAAIGNSAILRQPLTALFCSNRCPGSVLLRAFDKITQLRDAGRAVISGFHTPVEKECLAILLRGTSPSSSAPPAALTATVSRPHGKPRSPRVACCFFPRSQQPSAAPPPKPPTAATSSSPASLPRWLSSTRTQEVGLRSWSSISTNQPPA